MASDGEKFDPYYTWLGIPPEEQPPDYYRLLGVRPFEDNPTVIENLADQRMAHIRTFQTGPRSKESQRILNELAAAKVCLLNPAKKAAYDAQLREKFRQKQKGTPTGDKGLGGAGRAGLAPPPLPTGTVSAPILEPLFLVVVPDEPPTRPPARITIFGRKPTEVVALAVVGSLTLLMGGADCLELGEYSC
ncbi:MAG TPA: hypothetical protein PK777_14945 [Thermoguttaceae bacterium]|nr:hypothetical protein [Thermoguttaceae bacterium]